MFDILNYYINPERKFLEELAEALESTFTVIAFVEDITLDYIIESQYEICNVFGKYVDHVVSDVGVMNIVPAYYNFQSILDFNPSISEVKEMAEEYLNEYFTPPSLDDEFFGVFSEFYNSNSEEINSSQQLFNFQ
jgi:hypothetical protein